MNNYFMDIHPLVSLRTKKNQVLLYSFAQMCHLVQCVKDVGLSK